MDKTLTDLNGEIHVSKNAKADIDKKIEIARDIMEHDDDVWHVRNDDLFTLRHNDKPVMVFNADVPLKSYIELLEKFGIEVTTFRVA